ncbi:MAG: hypothetical protein WCJ62_11230, partial [Flavobacterium sp.]
MKKITLLLLFLASTWLNAQSTLSTSKHSSSFLLPSPSAPVVVPTSQTICSGNAITSINITNGNGAGIINGNFETGNLSSWNIDAVSPTPVVNSTSPHAGSYAAALGSFGSSEIFGDSSFYQTLNVPSGGATLSFWYKPNTVDTIDFDWQDAYITDTNSNILATIMHVCSSSNTWTQVNYDLSSYLGQTVRVKFLVHGDNGGDPTNMYLDDIVMTPKTNYAWTRDNTATVTGIAASGSGNVTGSLTNTTNAPITVTFTFTATNSCCSSSPTTATVVINPNTCDLTTISACGSYTWPAIGTTYNTSGTYTYL